MSLSLLSVAADDRVAAGIAAEARQLRDRSDNESASPSTYIPAFVAEYLCDYASILRMLHACQGDSGATAACLARSLAWREENKVYPVKRQLDSQELLVDSRGMVIVRARQATMLPRRRPSAVLTTDAQAESTGWRLFARGVDALEDTRVALKAAYQKHRLVAQAAVVVPVESLALADIATADIARILSVAKSFYPGAVGRVYVTAASSVLLEHARQALQPMLAALLGPNCDSQAFVVFARADSLAASHATKFDDCVAQLHHGAARAQTPAMSVAAKALSDCIGRADSCAESDDDNDNDDDFCSAYSDAQQTTRSATTSAHCGYSKQKWTGSRLSLNSRNTSTLSLGRHIDLAMSPVSSTVADSSARDHNSRSVITPIQLASLQRAVQGVQRMLGSINDSIVSADSRLALAASKSKLVQQADVLMSTVAALNFGVSMTTTTDSPRLSGGSELPLSKRTALYMSSKSVPHGGGDIEAPGDLFRRLALHLLALPLSQLVGGGRRGGNMLGVLRQLVTRMVRLVVRRLRQLPSIPLLLLLAYKHLRIYAMVFWTGAWIAWQANAAIIRSSLTTQLMRGIGF
ncbi:hypothetical protein GGI00_000999 [Coemansia sp. RSA 2681]|nr:hypothetical protein GGI00_000999 [Coemansia sp. RSA 2681]